MSAPIPGYDAWKLASPDEYDTSEQEAAEAAREERIRGAAPELYEALREMLTAFSLETEYKGPEAAMTARLVAKKHARAALAKADV